MREILADGEVLLERDRGVDRLTLTRPAKANALSRSMIKAIVSICGRPQPDRCALIITGSGGRNFCGGADLDEMKRAARDPGPRPTYLDLWDQMTATLSAMTVPVIAVINGTCLAGGLTLALACSIRVVVAGSLISYPMVSRGHLPGKYNLTRLVALVGHSRAEVILLGAKRLDASEALAWGLADIGCEPGETANVLESLLEPLRQTDPWLIAATRSLLSRPDDDLLWSQTEAAFEARTARIDGN